MPWGSHNLSIIIPFAQSMSQASWHKEELTQTMLHASAAQVAWRRSCRMTQNHTSQHEVHCRVLVQQEHNHYQLCRSKASCHSTECNGALETALQCGNLQATGVPSKVHEHIQASVIAACRSRLLVGVSCKAESVHAAQQSGMVF